MTPPKNASASARFWVATLVVSTTASTPGQPCDETRTGGQVDALRPGEDDDVVAALAGGVDDQASDQAGAAGHGDLHGFRMVHTRWTRQPPSGVTSADEQVRLRLLADLVLGHVGSELDQPQTAPFDRA